MISKYWPAFVSQRQTAVIRDYLPKTELFLTLNQKCAMTAIFTRRLDHGPQFCEKKTINVYIDIEREHTYI